jgi:RHS repeat-associated protein
VSQTALQTGYNFNPANNQITTSGFTYDGAGNMTNDTVHSYTYDAEGNITAVDGGSTAQYVYDAFNRRVHVQTSSGTTEYTYDYAGRRISSWLSPNNTGNEGRIYWDGQQFGYRSSDGTTYFDHQDTLGTERMRTDFGAGPGASFVSLPWGDGYTATTYLSGGSQDNNHFAGLERDAESGTEHAQFRNCASVQGRWFAPDSYLGSYDMTNPQSMNRYAYVLNNPLSLVDPSGLDYGFDCGDGCVGVTGTGGDGGDGGDILCWWCTEYGGSSGSECWWCRVPPSPSSGGGSGSTVSALGPSRLALLSAPNNGCQSVVGASSSIVSGSATSNIPTIEAGAAVGGAIGGPAGAFVGGIIGSFFGVGVTASYVSSSHTWYGGPTVVFGLGLGGGSGVSANAVNVPYPQNPNSIANGLSYSLTYQPSSALGSTVQYSPGSGPPVVGPSIGTRIPVSAGVSYNIRLNKGHC